MKATFSSNSISRYLPRYDASFHYCSKVLSKALVCVLIEVVSVLIDDSVLLDIDEQGLHRNFQHSAASILIRICRNYCTKRTKKSTSPFESSFLTGNIYCRPRLFKAPFLLPLPHQLNSVVSSIADRIRKEVLESLFCCKKLLLQCFDTKIS